MIKIKMFNVSSRLFQKHESFLLRLPVIFSKEISFLSTVYFNFF